MQVYTNTILNRMSLTSAGRVRPIMYDTFINDTGRPAIISRLRQLAAAAGWEVLPAPRVTPRGAPYFKEMYLEAAKRLPNCTYYGFTNADILFNSGLIDTLEAVEKVRQMLIMNGFTFIDRRYDIVANYLSCTRQIDNH